MNHSPAFVFDVVAVICFGVATLPWGSPINLVALGLVFFTLGHMF